MKIKFLPEDRKWVSLQERVIAASGGKLIEDLAPVDLARAILDESVSEDDIAAIREYRRRKRREDGFSPIISHRTWEDQRCDKSFAWLNRFVRCIVHLAVRMERIASHHFLFNRQSPYLPVLERIENQLFDHLDRTSERFTLQEGATWRNIAERIYFNATMLVPSDESQELIDSFFEQLEAFDAELEHERKESERLYDPPAGKKFFEIQVEHLRAHKGWHRYICASTERRARAMALRLFHEYFPNVRKNGWPFKISCIERQQLSAENYSRVKQAK